MHVTLIFTLFYKIVTTTTIFFYCLVSKIQIAF